MIKTFINCNGETALIDTDKTYTVETTWTTDGEPAKVQHLSGVSAEDMEMMLKGQGYREINHG